MSNFIEIITVETILIWLSNTLFYCKYILCNNIEYGWFIIISCSFDNII
jgi:hypothetical protein